MTETCGSASNSTTVTIKTFDYKVTFYDENGTTVLKATQTIDYGGSATAPSNPTKAYDSSKHYAFAGWTGDGYTNITSGAQTKTVKASYTGTVHDNYLQWITTDTTHKQVCSVCGYVKVAQASHNFGTWIEDTPATCTTTGERHHVCSVCNKSVSETIAALGHNMTAHPAVAATCTTAGNNAYWTCSRCNKVFSDANGTTETTVAAQTIAALNHDWDYAHATYSWTGYTACTATIPCSRNSSHTTTATATITSAVTTTATCTTDGIRTYTATFSNNQLSTQTKTENLGKNAANHTNLQHFTANAATCLAAGNTEYWYCSGCQKYFSNAAGTTEITQASTVIAQKAHSYTGAVRDNNDGTHSFKCVNGCNQYGGTVSCNYGDWGEDSATCLEGGTHSRTCQTCGHTDTAATSALGHNYQFTRTVAPTCTEQGYDIYTCSRCNATENRNYVNATGHSYGAWTYLNENQHQRVCANDASHVETENHSYGEWVNQNNGTKICTCTGCGHVKTMYIGYSVTFNGN
ncbi:MAG: InlB B-repeat-containing protein, partial [Clostridia bacterium]|nr:InlB B-repeat-containing protein [Clostridia bacterium]